VFNFQVAHKMSGSVSLTKTDNALGKGGGRVDSEYAPCSSVVNEKTQITHKNSFKGQGETQRGGGVDSAGRFFLKGSAGSKVAAGGERIWEKAGGRVGIREGEFPQIRERKPGLRALKGVPKKNFWVEGKSGRHRKKSNTIGELSKVSQVVVPNGGV